jgi:hypothetical protein
VSNRWFEVPDDAAAAPTMSVRTCLLIRERKHLLFSEQESVDEWYQLMDCLPPQGIQSDLQFYDRWKKSY